MFSAVTDAGGEAADPKETIYFNGDTRVLFVKMQPAPQQQAFLILEAVPATNGRGSLF